MPLVTYCLFRILSYLQWLTEEYFFQLLMREMGPLLIFILCSSFDLRSRISDDTTDTDIFPWKLCKFLIERTLKWKTQGTFSRMRTPVETSGLCRSFTVINGCWLLDKERRLCTRDTRRITFPEAWVPLNGSQMGRLIKAAPRLMLFMLMSIWANLNTEMPHLCGGLS